MERILVVKIGTSVLTDEHGQLRAGQIERLSRDVAETVREGWHPLIVSSGAVGAGRRYLRRFGREVGVRQRQALAAVGQPYLMEQYIRAFAERDRHVAQALITRADFTNFERYQNAIETIRILLEEGVIPIVNENDVVATEELTFGDNDGLAAIVAVALEARLLLVLTNTNGLYTADPRRHRQATRVPEVREITPEVLAYASSSFSSGGRGGMASKLRAAKVATNAGVPVRIVNGLDEGVIGAALRGEDIGTYVHAAPHGTRRSRRWWQFAGELGLGGITVDAGAARALRERKSLLVVGVRGVRGSFDAKELVEVFDEAGTDLGCGIVEYGAADLERALTLAKTSRSQLRKDFSREVIHSDNLSLYGNP